MDQFKRKTIKLIIYVIWMFVCQSDQSITAISKIWSEERKEITAVKIMVLFQNRNKRRWFELSYSQLEYIVKNDKMKIIHCIYITSKERERNNPYNQTVNADNNNNQRDCRVIQHELFLLFLLLIEKKHYDRNKYLIKNSFHILQ